MVGPIVEQSIEFGVDIVEYYKWLVYARKEFVLSKQILRSGTSIGANVHEGNFAVSRNDFIYKMQIALKEASETEYWLIILERTGFLPQSFHPLKYKCTSLKKMLISTLKTAKSRN